MRLIQQTKNALVKFKNSNTLPQALVLVGLLLLAGACGSSRDEDEGNEHFPPPQASPAPVPSPQADSKSGNQQPNLQDGQNPLACSARLRLTTFVDPSTHEKPTPALTAQVDPKCVQNKTGRLSFSSSKPLSIQALVDCNLVQGGDYSVKCVFKNADLFQKGNVSIPVILEPGADYRELRARIDFE